MEKEQVILALEKEQVILAFNLVEAKLKDLFDRISQLEAAPNEGTGSGAAPSDAEYLVNAADPGLSNEIVVTAIRGRIIYGNNTPAWITLAHPGAANRMLTTDANDVLWSAFTVNGSITGSGTIATGGFTGTIPATGTFAMGAGTLSVSSANNVAIAAHTHAITSSSNPGAAASILASNASGQLTLEDLFVTDGGIVGISGDLQLIFDGTADDLRAVLSDAAGTSLFVIEDSGNNVVFSVDSDGNEAVYGPTVLWDFDSANGSYEWGDRGTGGSIYLQNQISSKNTQLEIYAADGDITDDVSIQVFGLGTPGSVANRERMFFRWSASDTEYQILTEAAGTGTLRDLAIYTQGNTNQLRLDSNGGVCVNCAVATGQLHVDQSSLGAAWPVLVLDQADLSEEFINFIATVGAGNPIDTAAIGAYYGKARVAVNGTFKYVALYDS